MRSLALVGLLAACGDDPRATTFGGDRPADLVAPAMLTEGKRYPLLVVLHGYGASGFVQSAYFGVGALPDADEALLIAPDGTEDINGRLYWNVGPHSSAAGPDDVAYVGGLIDDIKAEWPVDPDAVFILGHSNGGYMAYQMACERADAIAAIV